MHRQVEENLEEILRRVGRGDDPGSPHLAECQECREQVELMREHAAELRSWRAPSEDIEPRPGFYARVMERIEAEGPGSIWDLVFDSMFGRRLAFASLALALLLGVYLVSTDAPEPEYAFADQAVEMLPVPVVTGQFAAMHDQAGMMLPGEPDEDAVLVNLVTYREQ